MILLTGASGFVGRQVLRKLEESGKPIRLVLREGSNRNAPLAANRDSVVTPDLFTRDAEWWSSVLHGIETVVHAAWYAEPGRYLESENNLDCLAGTLTLAKACIRAGVHRFVGIGTCFEYDLGRGILSKDTPLIPTTLYAACKVAAYRVLEQWFDSHQLGFAWCRLFYLYGEGEDSRRLVPYLRARLEAGEPNGRYADS